MKKKAVNKETEGFRDNENKRIKDMCLKNKELEVIK
jgi:hypothetical protein